MTYTPTTWANGAGAALNGTHLNHMENGIADAALKASNLSDLASAATARTNLGLGDSATKAVGTAAGTVAAGDDSRFTAGGGDYATHADLAAAGGSPSVAEAPSWSQRNLTIDVTHPPAGGFTAWVGDDAATDNTARIVATFEMARQWVNTHNGTVTINIPGGSYFHTGIDLSGMAWNNGFARLIINGVGTQRGVILACSNSTAANFKLQSAWNVSFNNISFYQGLYGLCVVLCEYFEVNSCYFEQQAPGLVGACVQVQYGNNVRFNGCHFLQSETVFMEVSSGATVAVRDSLIGEAVGGARVFGASLTLQNCIGFGNLACTDDNSVFFVNNAGHLTIQQCQFGLQALVGRFITAYRPGHITVQNSRISAGVGLVIFSCGPLDAYNWPPITYQGNTVIGPAPITLVAKFSLYDPTNYIPNNSNFTNNHFTFNNGTTPNLVVPAALLDQAANNVVAQNIIRASPWDI